MYIIKRRANYRFYQRSSTFCSTIDEAKQFETQHDAIMELLTVYGKSTPHFVDEGLSIVKVRVRVEEIPE